MIRSSVLTPFFVWLRARGHDVEGQLAAEKLPLGALDTPDLLVSFVASARLILNLGRTHGPDIGCRVVTDGCIADLGLLGQVVLGARTPRQALERVMHVMPYHSTHESVAVSRGTGVTVVRHAHHFPLNDEALNATHMFIAALLRAVVGGVGHTGPRLLRVGMTPHPALGLEHAQEWLDGVVEAEPGGRLAVTVADALLDRPFLHAPRGPVSLAGWSLARGDGTLAGSIRTILPGLMDYGRPSVEEIARIACMSPRTFQRRLAAEGTSVSDLVDAVRRDLALGRISDGADRIGDIAVSLGYSDQSSLSRAVRRWTACSPRHLRETA